MYTYKLVFCWIACSQFLSCLGTINYTFSHGQCASSRMTLHVMVHGKRCIDPPFKYHSSRSLPMSEVMFWFRIDSALPEQVGYIHPCLMLSLLYRGMQQLSVSMDMPACIKITASHHDDEKFDMCTVWFRSCITDGKKVLCCGCCSWSMQLNG